MLPSHPTGKSQTASAPGAFRALLLLAWSRNINCPLSWEMGSAPHGKLTWNQGPLKTWSRMSQRGREEPDANATGIRPRGTAGQGHPGTPSPPKTHPGEAQSLGQGRKEHPAPPSPACARRWRVKLPGSFFLTVRGAPGAEQPVHMGTGRKGGGGRSPRGPPPRASEPAPGSAHPTVGSAGPHRLPGPG